MDFSLSPEIESLRQKVAAFVEAEIMPLENDKANYDDHENFKESVVDALREKAKAAGLWGFQLPKERGGLDVGVAGMAVLYEEAARSPFGPVVFNCAPHHDSAQQDSQRRTERALAATHDRRQGAFRLCHDRAGRRLWFRSVPDLHLGYT